MNKEKKAIEIRIFGNNIKIVTDEDEDYVYKIVAYLNNKLEEISKKAKIASNNERLILVALSVADEYFKLKDGSAGQEFSDTRCANIIGMIDDALNVN